MIVFVDETELNPLPAGICVTVNPGALVGWTQAGGLTAITLTPSTAYTASFSGSQAPKTSQGFTSASSGTTTVTVAAYRSPSLSQTGYALEQARLWPTGPGWFSDAARAPGGNAYAVAYGLAAVLALLDGDVQAVLQTMRLQSSTGADIASWVADFFGTTLFPYANETDQQFIARVIRSLSRFPATLPTLQAIVDEFFTCTIDMSAARLVFDTQSDPIRSGFYNIVPGQFAIALYYQNPYFPPGLFIGQSFIGQDSFISDPYGYAKSDISPYPALGAMINGAKAEGVEPVYIVSRGEPPGLGTWDVPTWDDLQWATP